MDRGVGGVGEEEKAPRCRIDTIGGDDEVLLFTTS